MVALHFPHENNRKKTGKFVLPHARTESWEKGEIKKNFSSLFWGDKPFLPNPPFFLWVRPLGTDTPSDSENTKGRKWLIRNSSVRNSQNWWGGHSMRVKLTTLSPVGAACL